MGNEVIVTNCGLREKDIRDRGMWRNIIFGEERPL